MGSLNKVMLIGNLGKDPDYKQVNGRPMARFTIATNRQWKGGGGEEKKETTWHTIVAWGALADTCGRYLTKGKQVYIEGRIQNRKWTDKDGNDRYMTEVVAGQMVMLGRKGDVEEIPEVSGPPSDASGEDHGTPPVDSEEPPF